MPRDSEMGGRSLGGGGGSPALSAILMSDRREGPDLLGAADAMRPLAELCLAADAETPFAIALVGGRGAGKSFALRRLVEAIEARAAKGGAALGKIVVASVDAAGGARDPASTIAAAVFEALERDHGGTSYTELADEAAHAGLDPRRAAAAAVERHDEIVGRLEHERRAREEVESRRARIAESLLHETPGSRIDGFARGSRSTIEARLRRFGFIEGDASANFRSLVGDLQGLRAGSRVGVFLRAIFAYRGQTRLIVVAVLAFALAFGLDRLRTPQAGDQLLALSAQFAPLLDAIKTHGDAVEYGIEALVVGGIAALFVNLWRAASFTGLLYRGLRLLNLDIRERRRELDASAARLERRVAALQIEADAANQRAETLARRAGGGAPTSRPPGPAFLAPAEAPARAARDFLRELGRAMRGATPPAPQRLLIAIDHVDALPPDEARRFLDAAVRLAAPGAAVIAAADLTRLDGDPREIAESLFELVYDVEALGEASGAGAASRLLGAPTPAAPPVGETSKALLTEPLTEAELRQMKAASALIGPRPRALKRFYNAYRLARLAEAPRPAVALALAALMAPDPDVAARLRWAMAGEGALEGELTEAARGLDKAALRRGFAVARRFAPWGK